jgi:uncharacterized protein
LIKFRNWLFTGHDNILNPLAAALFLGFVVALSLLWFGKGLHVSGIFAVLCANESVEAVKASDALFCSANAPQEDRTWMYWMVGGVFTGGLISSVLRRRTLKFFVERGTGVNLQRRFVNAAAGGVLVGIGAAIAGGCTSSLGLTGAALLTTAGFAFLLMFFIGAFVARIGFGRFWK